MKKINVVFATDQNYIAHLTVAILSLLENNRDIEFTIYIINGGIEERLYKKLLTVTCNYKCKIINAEISDDVFNNLVISNHFTKANYYRLLIPKIVNDHKTLYLDADLIVNGSIKELYEIDISDFFVGAVEDPNFDGHADLGMKHKSDYFNSGVMIVNVDRWKRENLTERIIEFVSNNSSVIRYVDQCGLNAIIDGEWKKIPAKFNQQSIMLKEDSKMENHPFTDEELTEARKEPIIVHYTGSSKPWQFGNNHPYKNLYYHYLKSTPFYKRIPEGITVKSIVHWILPNPVIKLIKRIKQQLT